MAYTYLNIAPGDKVAFSIPNGRNIDGSIDYKEITGRVVMRGSHGWVVNIGGRHGTPKICDETNFIRITRKGT